MTGLVELPAILDALGIPRGIARRGQLDVRSPIDGNTIAGVVKDDPVSVNQKVKDAEVVYQSWRTVPAPRRGELIRLFGEKLRRHMGSD